MAKWYRKQIYSSIFVYIYITNILIERTQNQPVSLVCKTRESARLQQCCTVMSAMFTVRVAFAHLSTLTYFSLLLLKYSKLYCITPLIFSSNTSLSHQVCSYSLGKWV